MEIVTAVQNRKYIDKLAKFGVTTYLLADKDFSSSPKGMSRKAISLAIKEVHKINKRAAAKVDRLYQQNEVEQLREYLSFLSKEGCDDVFFSDIAIKQISEEMGLGFNTIYAPETLITNCFEVQELKNDGFGGLVISKDIPLGNALTIADQVPDYSYLRVHGPILMSYSERRFISAYLNSKKEYLDDYYLSEENRKMKMPIVEKRSGTWFYYACLYCLDSIQLLHDSKLKGMIFDCFLYDDQYTLEIMELYAKAMNNMKVSLQEMKSINESIEYIEISDIKLTQLEKE